MFNSGRLCKLTIISTELASRERKAKHFYVKTTSSLETSPRQKGLSLYLCSKTNTWEREIPFKNYKAIFIKTIWAASIFSTCRCLHKTSSKAWGKNFYGNFVGKGFKIQTIPRWWKVLVWWMNMKMENGSSRNRSIKLVPADRCVIIKIGLHVKAIKYKMKTSKLIKAFSWNFVEKMKIFFL